MLKNRLVLSKQIAILGCGWLGLPLATSLLENGYQVRGSTTSEGKITNLEMLGVEVFIIDLKPNAIKGNIEGFLKNADTLIISVPPKLRKNPEGDFVGKMECLINEIKNGCIAHVIFISSTSVYGNLEGKITENSNLHPITESGKQLVEAENLLKQHRSFKTTIIRFAGLIGEDRHPANFLSGKKGIKHPNSYVNLIHQKDCIEIIKKIIANTPENKTYHAAYPSHPIKRDYYTRQALKKGLAPPEFVPSDFKGKWIASDYLMKDLQYHFIKDINL